MERRKFGESLREGLKDEKLLHDGQDDQGFFRLDPAGRKWYKPVGYDFDTGELMLDDESLSIKRETSRRKVDVERNKKIPQYPI